MTNALRRVWNVLTAPHDGGPPYCHGTTASHWSGIGGDYEVCDQPGCWYDEDDRIHCYWSGKPAGSSPARRSGKT